MLTLSCRVNVQTAKELNICGSYENRIQIPRICPDRIHYWLWTCSNLEFLMGLETLILLSKVDNQTIQEMFFLTIRELKSKLANENDPMKIDKINQQIERIEFVINSAGQSSKCIQQLEENLINSNKAFHAVYLDWLKTKKELNELKPKLNDLSNLEPNLRRLKIGNSYFNLEQ